MHVNWHGEGRLAVIKFVESYKLKQGRMGNQTGGLYSPNMWCCSDRKQSCSRSKAVRSLPGVSQMMAKFPKPRLLEMVGSSTGRSFSLCLWELDEECERVSAPTGVLLCDSGRNHHSESSGSTSPRAGSPARLLFTSDAGCITGIPRSPTFLTSCY